MCQIWHVRTQRVKGLDRFSQNLIPDIVSSISQSLQELDNSEKIFKKFKISKNVYALIDFCKIQYNMLCAVLGR